LEDRVVLSFATPVSYPGSAGAPASVAVGDFNGDGKPDLITANTSAGTVDVFLNQGNGTYGTPITSHTGNNPVDIEVGDLNDDGKEDIVALGSYYLSAMTVLSGNGDGTFQAPVAYPETNPPTEIQIHDMNGDNHPDIVMDNEFFNSTSVLMNNGDGTFGAKLDTPAGSFPSSEAIGDFNGDGKPDLVVTAAGVASVGVLTANGDGTFQAVKSLPIGGPPTGVVVGDFNGDGKADIAVAQQSPANSVGILLGNGDGTFQPVSNYAVGGSPLNIATADFNGDGVTDLIEETSSGYSVELGRGDGSFYAPETTAVTGVRALAIGDFNGDGAPDVATTSTGSTSAVSVLMNSGNTAALLDGAVTFTVSTPATSTAGAAVPVTVTAVDANGNPVTGFLGTIGIGSNDPQGGGAVTTYTFTAADAGTHTFTSGVKLFTAGPETVTVTAALMTSASQSVQVTPAAATHFSIAAPATAVAGTPATFTVTALDGYGNTATGYTGSVRFTSTDGQATLPTATFTTADAGVQAVSVVLKTVANGGQRINAFDTVTTTITGASGTTLVTPAAARSFSLSSGGGFIGSPHAITVTARDAYGNAATSYNGTVHITSSDAQAFLPADGALTSGVGTFQWTPMTLGTQTLTANDTTDATIGGTESVVVTPGAATRFVVTPVTGTTAGTSQSFTVTAYDVYGNVSNVYTGTVLIGSSDFQASGTVAYTFTAADAGVHTFNITFKTAGVQSLTVRDSVNLSLTSTQTGITITPAAASSMSVTPLPLATTAGAVNTVTVTLRDPYGNIATGYQGTLNFSSVDTQAALPAAYTFTAADAGVHTFNIVFKTAEDATLVVQDPANLALTSSQGNIRVSAGAVAGFTVSGPSNATKGTAVNITVKAVDAYGNIVTNYLGKVHLSDSVSGAVLPADYTFTAADNGAHVFAITLNSTGLNTIKVVDTASNVITGSLGLNVTSGTGGGGGGGGATGGGGGGGGGGGKGAA
jgi:hypothetical protein